MCLRELMGIDLLAANLQEIYAAVLDQQSAKLTLVPSYNGKRVYSVNFFWENVWRVLPEKDKKEKLTTALDLTKKLFEDNLSLIEKHTDKFKKYLEEKAQGKNPDEAQVHDSRNFIKKWSFSTSPFIWLLEEGNDKLRSFFQKRFSSYSSFDCKQEYKEAQKCMSIMDLEDALFEPLPLNIIRKLFKDVSLSIKEERELREFIKKLTINPDTLHDALTGIYDLFSDCSKTIAEVELVLYSMGVKIFEDISEEYFAYRSGIKKGSKIAYNGKELTVGKQLGKKLHGQDSNIFFKIEGEKEKVIWFGRNRAILGYKEEFAKKENCFVPFIKFYEFDSMGRFAIVERLYDPLDKIAWKSTDTVHHDDVVILEPIVKLITWMIDQGRSPIELKAKNVYFDKDGCLKSTKFVQYNLFRFTALEDFIFGIAQNNLTIFKYLMKKSKLKAHPNRLFFEVILHRTLLGEDVDVINVGFVKGIKDSFMIERGEPFIKSVKKLKAKCMAGSTYTGDDLEKKVNEAIIKAYNDSFAGSYLWKTIFDEVIKFN